MQKRQKLSSRRKFEHDEYALEDQYSGMLIGEMAIRALEPEWCWYDYSKTEEHRRAQELVAAYNEPPDY